MTRNDPQKILANFSGPISILIKLLQKVQRKMGPDAEVSIRPPLQVKRSKAKENKTGGGVFSSQHLQKKADARKLAKKQIATEGKITYPKKNTERQK